jgi:transcription elongation factor Elf1
MIHKWKEKCDICGKWSEYYTTIDNGKPKGLLICDECKSKEVDKDE